MTRLRHTAALFVALLLAAAIPAPAFAGDPPAAAETVPLAERVAERLRAEMDSQELVGLSVALVIDGRVAHTAGFGWQDRENEVPVTDATMYRWASISKPLTAVVAMQLAREGALDPDADVRSYVPEFPKKPQVITSRQLLCHQGGIVHYTNGPVVITEREYDNDNPFEDAILALDRFKRSPLVAEPGTAYSYTTHGYMLLGAVAERAGGQPYWALVRERICEPLGLETLQPDYQWLEIPNRAVGYRRRGGEVRPSTDTDVSWKLAGGGFISNVHDLAAFGAGLLGDELLDDGLKGEMWVRQRTADGSETGYGLGFRVEGEGQTLRVSHGGSQEKARTHLIIAPAHNAGVALMSNTEHARLPALARELLELVIQETAGTVEVVAP